MNLPYRRTLFFLFWASGVIGLTYEVIWTRMLNLVFGNTVYATATVLTAFMAGLAIGSFAFGRFVDRRQDPLRVYAFLEIGLGFYAFLLPQLTPLYKWIYQSFGATYYVLSLVRFVISCLLLLLPTILMGGTLPVMSRHFIRSRGTVGKDVGLLYGFNTFGAVVGCFWAGFIFIFTFGTQATAFLAAAINILVGFGALMIYTQSTPLPIQEEKNRTKPKKKKHRIAQQKYRDWYSLPSDARDSRLWPMRCSGPEVSSRPCSRTPMPSVRCSLPCFSVSPWAVSSIAGSWIDPTMEEARVQLQELRASQ